MLLNIYKIRTFWKL